MGPPAGEGRPPASVPRSATLIGAVVVVALAASLVVASRADRGRSDAGVAPGTSASTTALGGAATAYFWLKVAMNF